MLSPKPRDVAATLLLRAVFQPDGKPQDRNSFAYRGSVFEDDLGIRRNLNFQNPDYPWVSRHNVFVPVIWGKLEHARNQTEITITVLFDLPATLISAIFYGLLIVVGVEYALQSSQTGTLDWNVFGFVGLFLAALYIWQMASFNYEVRQTKTFLMETIEARDSTA